jgi:hypothetical protein
MDKTLRFWVDVTYEHIKSHHDKLMSRVGAVVLVTVLWSGGVATAYYPPGTLRTKISSHLEKKVCEGVIRPLTGHYTFGKIDGYVAGLCIFGADKEDAILGATT